MSNVQAEAAALMRCAHAALEAAASSPCRSPYCECEQGKCTHPGFFDCRGAQSDCKAPVEAELREALLVLSDRLIATSTRPAHTKALLASLSRPSSGPAVAG